MFVLVNTFVDHDYTTDTSNIAVGAVYGPFDSKETAEKERDAMQFPNPELVCIRRIHTA
jgi:hypothetical protein